MKFLVFFDLSNIISLRVLQNFIYSRVFSCNYLSKHCHNQVEEPGLMP